MSDKNNSLFAWACLQLREAIDEGLHGNVIINLRGGEVRGAEIQRHAKPPLDVNGETA